MEQSKDDSISRATSLLFWMCVPFVALILVIFSSADLAPTVQRTTIPSFILVENSKAVKPYVIRKKILDEKINLNEADRDGYTALHLAVLKNPDIIPILISEGARINAQDNNGYTALHFATLQGDYKAVKSLITLGADVKMRNKDNEQPIDTLRRMKRNLSEDAYLKSQNLLNDASRTERKVGYGVLRVDSVDGPLSTAVY